jgi:hypothetical protein
MEQELYAAGLALKLTVEQADDVACLFVLFNATLDQFAGMNNRPVVLAPKGVAYVAQRDIRQLAGEKHGDLARKSDIRRASLAGHIRQTDVKMLGNFALDLLDGDSAARLF